MPKEEMLTFSKSGMIPTSHVHIHDNESVHLACSLFKVRTIACKTQKKKVQ